MRRYTSLLLVGMIAALVALMYVQREGDAAAPAPTGGGSGGGGSAIAGGGPGPGSGSGRGSAAPAAKAAAGAEKGATTAEAPPPPKPQLARPLRAVALGWELLAPGVVAGEAAYKAAGVEASFANAGAMDDIESALARGGGEAGGADLAIVPLSSYVASYERLRALSPEVVLVIGWSRGREAMFATDTAALAKPPAAGELKLAAASATAPETFLSLFLLDLAGVPASRVTVVDPQRASLAAVQRGTGPKPTGKLLVTSADTPRLLPIVAVAPRGFIAAHADELEAWTKVWLAGVGKLAGDVPAGGRKVAGMTGAPPVLGIIEALGQVEFASLRENAAAAGLSGRGALTLDELFRSAWRIWREAGVLTTPPPEVAPLHTGVIATLVRADPAAAAELPRPRQAADGGARPAVLLVARAPVGKDGKLDAEAFATRIGIVAGVFDRQALRVSVLGDQKTAQVLADLARDRFGLRPAQLSVGRRPPANLPGAIEVLSAM
jgi:hypothetical protein